MGAAAREPVALCATSTATMIAITAVPNKERGVGDRIVNPYSNLGFARNPPELVDLPRAARVMTLAVSPITRYEAQESARVCR